MADYNKKNSMGNNTDGCMDWDDAIENDGKEFQSVRLGAENPPGT